MLETQLPGTPCSPASLQRPVSSWEQEHCFPFLTGHLEGQQQWRVAGRVLGCCGISDNVYSSRFSWEHHSRHFCSDSYKATVRNRRGNKVELNVYFNFKRSLENVLLSEMDQLLRKHGKEQPHTSDRLLTAPEAGNASPTRVVPSRACENTWRIPREKHVEGTNVSLPWCCFFWIVTVSWLLRNNTQKETRTLFFPAQEIQT